MKMLFKKLIGAAFVLFLLGATLATNAQNHLNWAKTPPMGWNSYDCFGAAVNEEEVRGNAKMMEVHLKDAGWEYVVIDYCWYYPHVGALNNPPQTEDYKPSLPMDEYGRLLPAIDRFPSAANGQGFKEIADYVHSLGLKFGIHIMRGIPREAVARKMPIKGTNYTADQITDHTPCRWLNTMWGVDMDKPGAQEYYNSLFEMYADWGVDYVKADDMVFPYYSSKEIEGIRKAIDNCGRKIVISLSPGDGIPIEQAEHLKVNANLWRISSDFWDDWESLKQQFDVTHNWEKHIGTGHWPDADMIPFGRLNKRGPHDGGPRESNFTLPEKYTLMTLWSIARSPLMYGGDLMAMRPTELKLLTNAEILAVNQNSSNNRQLVRTENMVAWVADVPGTNDKYLAVFNISDDLPLSEKIQLSDLGFAKSVKIRDLWNHTDMGAFSGEFLPEIENHGAGMFKLTEN
jgi:hypothetical protein